MNHLSYIVLALFYYRWETEHDFPKSIMHLLIYITKNTKKIECRFSGYGDRRAFDSALKICGGPNPIGAMCPGASHDN